MQWIQKVGNKKIQNSFILKQTYKSAKYQWMNFANLSFFQPIPAIIAIITKEKKTAKKRSIESKWSRGLGHEIRKDSKSSGSQDIDCQSASCVQRMSKMLEGTRLNHHFN